MRKPDQKLIDATEKKMTESQSLADMVQARLNGALSGFVGQQVTSSVHAEIQATVQRVLDDVVRARAFRMGSPAIAVTVYENDPTKFHVSVRVDARDG